MRKITFHIGYPKTATTKIQKELYGKETEDWSCPSFTGVNHSTVLGLLFGRDVDKISLFTERGLSKNTVSYFREIWNRELHRIFSGSKDIFFSGEEIIFFDESTLLKIYSLSKDYFDDISIIVTIREPFEYQNSLLQERIKRSFLSSIVLPDVNYQKEIEKIYSVFGEEKTHIIPHHNQRRSLGQNYDFFKIFCQALGINHFEKSMQFPNSTLSLEAISLLYCHNKFGTNINGSNEWIQKRKMLIQTLRSFGNSEFLIFRNDRDQSMLNKETNWLSKELGFTFSKNEHRDKVANVKSEYDLFCCAKYAIVEWEKHLRKSFAKSTIRIDGTEPEQIARILDSIETK